MNWFGYALSIVIGLLVFALSCYVTWAHDLNSELADTKEDRNRWRRLAERRKRHLENVLRDKFKYPILEVSSETFDLIETFDFISKSNMLKAPTIHKTKRSKRK